jgi:hypothetical protein
VPEFPQIPHGLRAIALAGTALLAACGGAGSDAVTVTINTAVTHPISPYIYGINFASRVAGLPAGLAADRLGGNRLTAFNWVTNASNAGNDYNYQNDSFLSGSTTAAEAVREFVATDRSKGMASIITFQLQGLVAGDVGGPVNVAKPPDRSRFKRVLFQKSIVSDVPFTVAPPPGEETVYMDEFIWAVDQAFPGQDIFRTKPAAQPVFAELDNEPELWSSTHLEIQGAARVPADLYIAKTISLASALKTQFPELIIMGPAHYGFYGMYAWNGELAPTPEGSNWFTDKYLLAVRSASSRFGKPLIDVYDFHWYPEVKDESGKRITTLNEPTLTDAQAQAIAQSPRSLWDPSYSENSWVTQALGKPIAILARVQSRIAAENPGMKIAITEYNHGGAQHIAGTLAQADALGIFGAQNLFAANLWLLIEKEPYVLAGFRAFRDFDGDGHNFGDIALQTESSNVAAVAAYASMDSTRPGRVVVVVINRSVSAHTTAFAGLTGSGTAHIFRISAASAKSQHEITPLAVESRSLSDARLQLSLPPMSVTTIDIR